MRESEQPENDSAFLRHIPCEPCGSRDANSLYTDGHTYCFACGAHSGSTGEGSSTPQRTTRVVSGLISGDVRGLRARKITEATAAHFGYRVGDYKGKTVQIAPYYDADGQLVAQKIRYADKRFKVLGEIKQALPFGAQAFPKSGKMVVVTEGEVDALSMSQVQGNKWPVVSIGCGAGAQIRKYFAKHQGYFKSFDKVVLMFDMDEPGRAAVREAAAVLGGRAHIADLPLKDASEMLVAGRTEELLNAMWRAKQYRPEGILDMADLHEAVMKKPEWGLSWPFEALTKLTYGIRTGEIYSLGAGTGIGKTDFLTQTMKHLVMEHKVPIGVFALEQSPGETATRIMGKVAGKVFHIPDGNWTDDDKEKAWEQMNATGKVFLYDSFGQNDWAIVREKIEYLHHAYDIRHFFLDHLTALAASQDDERKELETIMAEMGGLVKQLDIAIIVVSHLSTPDGKSHEEGGRVTIRHFKGSRAIGFWSHFMFGLERDQQSDSADAQQVTVFRCLKDRYTGRSTGKLFHFRYDQSTGLLYECEDPGKEPASARHGFDTEEPETGSVKGSDF